MDDAQRQPAQVKELKKAIHFLVNLQWTVVNANERDVHPENRNGEIRTDEKMSGSQELMNGANPK